MDIAKIRKKAKEQEKKDIAQSSVRPEEPCVERREEGGQIAVEKAAAPLPTRSTESEPDEDLYDTVIAPASAAPPGESLPDRPPASEEEGQAPETGKDGDAVVELLTFSLSKEEFAFRVSEVEEIIRYQPITRVPTMPEYVLGITSLRGKIMPVIDLKTRIVFKGVRGDEAERDAQNRVGNKKIFIVLGPKGPIGVTIDRVNGVVRLPRNGVLEPPAHLLEEERKFVDGVVILDKRFVSIVRCEEALNIEVA
jgi:purine-binding chemotaxis protein CheW